MARSKCVCFFLTLASLATPVAPSALIGSDRRSQLHSGAGRLRGARCRQGVLNSSAAVAPLVPVGPETPIKFLISAFQDGERCANTLFQALVEAEHPERVSFNVLQAAGPRDVLCDEEFRRKQAPALCRERGGDVERCLGDVLGRVRFQSIALEDGQGPVHQRGLLSEFADLSGDGAMCLATDAHMGFARHWDRILLEDWAETGNEFAVLSAYPFAIEQMDLAGTGSWVELCGYFLTDRGIPRGATARPAVEGRKTGRPQLTMNWAAGQSFARCHAEKNVPVDKNMVFMFDGEEVNRAVRFWTSGYDLYNPRVNVVLHNYSNAAQKFWSYSGPDLPQKRAGSEGRLRALLQGQATEEAFGKYGLGNQRSLEQYVTWARTDLGGKWRDFLKRKGITPNFDGFVPTGASQPTSEPNFCNQLQRVPVRDVQALVSRAAAAAAQ